MADKGLGTRTAGMLPRHIGLLAGAQDPAVSPDGSAVACTIVSADLEANRYGSAVWVSRDGAAATQLTKGDRREAQARWSPDGRELAYVTHPGTESDPDAPGCEVYVVAADGSEEPRLVLTWPEEIEELAWSPDGTRLAFTGRSRDEARYGPERDRDRPPVRITRLYSRVDDIGWVVDRPRHLFVVDAGAPGVPVDLTPGPWEVSGAAWSPDGTQLAFSSGRHDTWDLDRAVDLWTVEASGPGAEPLRLTKTSLTYCLPAWSPSGGHLAFVVFDQQVEPSHGQVGVLDLDSGAIELLTPILDRNGYCYGSLRAPVWRGDELLFSVEDGGSIHLYSADPGADPEPVVAGELQVKGFDAAGGTLAWCAATAAGSAELYVGGNAGPLTSAGATLQAECEPLAPEVFRVPSTGGEEVEAWIIRPAGFVEGERYPTLLNIHGGPFAQYGYTLFDEFQIQAGAGYAVLYCNPRGSSGYSERWGRAIRWPEAGVHPGTGWGGVDYEDLMAVVDTAVARFPFVDPDRLGVLGGSYGGYMTAWVVSHTDRFGAACAERSAINLLSLEATSDIAGSFVGYVGATHLDDPEAYLRYSPITYVESITTPLLILHSENDLRCPIGQADELFTALRVLGRPVELVRFPGEGHELSRSGSPRHRVQRAEIILEWFDRHLR